MVHKRMGAQLRRLSIKEFKEAPKLPLTLVVDNVRSGYNVGALFRTADGFRIERIILCGITPRPPYREILKTALGATESVDWTYEAQTVQALQALRAADYHITALEQTDESIPLHHFSFTEHERYALVVGSEITGISDEALALCHSFVEIPQWGTKHSLNVAVATGIALWECARQRWL